MTETGWEITAPELEDKEFVDLVKWKVLTNELPLILSYKGQQYQVSEHAEKKNHVDIRRITEDMQKDQRMIHGFTVEGKRKELEEVFDLLDRHMHSVHMMKEGKDKQDLQSYSRRMMAGFIDNWFELEVRWKV